MKVKCDKMKINSKLELKEAIQKILGEMKVVECILSVSMLH